MRKLYKLLVLLLPQLDTIFLPFVCSKNDSIYALILTELNQPSSGLIYEIPRLSIALLCNPNQLTSLKPWILSLQVHYLLQSASLSVVPLIN